MIHLRVGDGRCFVGIAQSIRIRILETIAYRYLLYRRRYFIGELASQRIINHISRCR